MIAAISHGSRTDISRQDTRQAAGRKATAPPAPPAYDHWSVARNEDGTRLFDAGRLKQAQRFGHPQSLVLDGGGGGAGRLGRQTRLFPLNATPPLNTDGEGVRIAILFAPQPAPSGPSESRRDVSSLPTPSRARCSARCVRSSPAGRKHLLPQRKRPILPPVTLHSHRRAHTPTTHHWNHPKGSCSTIHAELSHSRRSRPQLTP